jgi:hypothetical protein
MIQLKFQDFELCFSQLPKAFKHALNYGEYLTMAEGMGFEPMTPILLRVTA